MTRDELKKHFAHKKYSDIREQVYAVMLDHPEITEPYTIEAAACEIKESKGEGVALSIEDALRLVAGETPPDTNKILRELSDMGMRTAGDLIALLNNAQEQLEDSEFHAEDMNPEAFKALAVLMNGAVMLTRNRDIVVLGLPEADREVDYAVMRVAFFTDDLTDSELNILNCMKSVSDKVFTDERPNAMVIRFKVDNIWNI